MKKHNYKLCLAFLLSLFFLTSCSQEMKTLKTVPGVDLNRYTGKWYEIARLPNSFEEGLICCTAEYSLRDDGKFTVVNTGHKETDPSKSKSVKGKAWVPDPNEPGRLKVQFSGPSRQVITSSTLMMRITAMHSSGTLPVNTCGYWLVTRSSMKHYTRNWLRLRKIMILIQRNY
jgi:lipocalin